MEAGNEDQARAFIRKGMHARFMSRATVSTGSSNLRSSSTLRLRPTRKVRGFQPGKRCISVNEAPTPAFPGRKPDSVALKATVRLAQQGDAAAFETIFQLHSRRVYALCLRMVNDPVEAEDLAQDAFLQLFRKIHTFRGESAFSSWLHRLTANVVLMSFRRKKPHATSLDEMMRADDDNEMPRIELGGVDAQLSGVCDRLNLQRAIEGLPDGYRLMFLLHDAYGYEHNEISRMLDCSVGNSKSQLHKARKRLRALLMKMERRRKIAA
jgi:RNA polymerase sigma-70 factor (ECF subfamily)